MGVVLALGLGASAVIDAGVGARLTRLMPDAAAAARFQFIGSILCAAAFAAIFAGFWIPVEHRFAYALATGLAFRVAYAVYDVPQNALMTLATRDPRARNRVAATRIWFSGLATLVIAAAVAPMIAGRGETGAALYLGVAVAMAAPAVLAAGLLAWRARRVDPAASAQEPAARGGRLRPSRTFWLMMALMAITSLATPLFSKVEPFYAVYVLRSPALGGAIVAGMAVGILAGQPLWPFVSARLTRAGTTAIAALLQLFGLGLIVVPGAPVWSLILAAFAFGVGNGGVGMALWAGFSDVAARDAPGREGLAFGLFSGLAKICLAAGGLGLGLALTAGDYRAPDGGLLPLLMAGIPALGALACLIVAWLWARRGETGSGETGAAPAPARS